MSKASSSTKQVARSASIVMFAIFLSRVLGFVRERAIASVFGRGLAADAFFAAFGIPDLMYQLLVGGVISSAFIPIFTQYLTAEDEKEAWYIASSFVNFTAIMLLILTILGIIFAPILAPLVGVGFVGEQRNLLITLMRITFPAVFFTALSGLEMGILNSYKQFTLPALGPLLYNTAQILSAYLLGPIFGILGMAYGTVIGSFSSFSIQFPAVLKRGSGYFRRVIDFKHPGIRKMIKLMIPAIIGLSIVHINMIVGQNLASLLDEGAITALRLANRLINFPLGVFAMGLSTAIFPTLTGLAAKKEMDEFRNTFAFGLRIVYYVTLPSAVGMAVLRVPIVRLLFESGEFTASDTNVTAYALLFYSAGLFAQSGLQILTRVYYSLQDTVTPVKIGLLTVVLNFAFSMGFLTWTNLGIGGLALAFSLTSMIQMSMYILMLRRKIGAIDGRRIANTILRAAIASVVMGVAAYYTAQFIGSVVELSSTVKNALQVFAGIAVGVLVYVLASFVLKMDEPRFVVNLIRERLMRKRRSSQE